MVIKTRDSGTEKFQLSRDEFLLLRKAYAERKRSTKATLKRERAAVGVMVTMLLAAVTGALTGFITGSFWEMVFLFTPMSATLTLVMCVTQGWRLTFKSTAHALMKTSVSRALTNSSARMDCSLVITALLDERLAETAEILAAEGFYGPVHELLRVVREID